MEQWNMTNPSLYEYFFENFNRERYTLEQAQLLSYIEIYLEEDIHKTDFRNFKNRIYDSHQTVAAIAQQLSTFGFPSVEAHKKTYRKCINEILSCTLNGLTLDICRDPSNKKTQRTTYEITRSDLLFFNYLFVTRKTKNTQCLLKCKNKYYDQIDDDYYDLLKSGLEDLILNHESEYTLDDIEFCFEYKFGRARRQLLTQRNSLNTIIAVIANFDWNNRELISTYKQCVSTLEETEKKLLDLYSSFFDDSDPNILVKLGITTK
jgi:hypothetical protein